jgi:hypothetical protein
VVLTDGSDRDIPGDDELVVLLVIREIGHPETDRREEVMVSLGDSAGGVSHVVVLKIDSHGAHEGCRSGLRGGEVDVRAHGSNGQRGVLLVEFSMVLERCRHRGRFLAMRMETVMTAVRVYRVLGSTLIFRGRPVWSGCIRRSKFCNDRGVASGVRPQGWAHLFR